MNCHCESLNTRHFAQNNIVWLGRTPRPQYNNAQGKERRQLIQEEVRAGAEEIFSSRMVRMRQQASQLGIPSPLLKLERSHNTVQAKQGGS